MSTDPFSDILKFANAQSVVSGSFTVGGAWAIRWEADKIRFFGVVKGGCWLCIDGEEAPVRVERGDVFLLSARRSFILAGDPANIPVDAVSVFSGGISKSAKLGDGGDCIQIGGHVLLDPASGGILMDVLPPLIHVRAASAQAATLQWLLDQLVREGAAELPGAGAASAQLAQLIFIQLLRAFLAGGESFPVGWLRAFCDARFAPALRLMHAEPGRLWRLEELARSAAMSRTTFAVRFKAAAGVPPLTYLLNWRMRLAERALREQNVSIFDLALSLGYTSESAFSNAFKRVVGMAPKRYQTACRAAGQANTLPA